MRVIKALNNNMVLARDDSGSELICQGKGIGFQKRSGDFVDQNRVERCFFPANQDESVHFQQLFSEIPDEFWAIAAVIIMAISVAVTFILFKDPEVEADEEEAEAAPAEAPKPLVNKVVLTAPLTGEIQALADIPDAVFSSGALGEGTVVIPTVGKVVAPCDATVSATMETKHAVGLSTDDGMELLIHVGLNTVELNGKFFEYKVNEGDSVKRGDTLIEFDINGIKAAGYQLNTPLLVTNADDYVSIKTVASGSVKAGDELLSIV